MDGLVTKLHELLKHREEPDWSLKTLKSILAVLFVMGVLSFCSLLFVDFFQPSNSAVNRFLARLNAPLAAYLYKHTISDQITILMYDDRFLQENDLSWPLSYRDQAAWLLSAAGNGTPNARPKAVFIDITFGQERPNDPGIGDLVDALCTIGVDWQIPLYLAGLPDPRTGDLVVRSKLFGAEKNGKPCFKLVGVDYEPDPIDGYAWSYPLYQHTEIEDKQKVLVHGRKDTSDPVIHEFPTAALAIAEGMGSNAPDSKTRYRIGGDPLAVYWGAASVIDPDGIHRIETDCTPGTSDLRDKLPSVIIAIIDRAFPENTTPRCSVHRSLSFSDLNSLDEDIANSLIHDKYVLVGAKVGGFNDWINSPIQGPLPGIHLHAMALDNLMTFRDSYKIQHEWHAILHEIKHGNPLNSANGELITAFSLTLTILTLTSFYFAYIKTSIKSYIKKPPKASIFKDEIKSTAKFYNGGSVFSFLFRAILEVLRWLFRIIVGVFLTLVLLLVFQSQFRTGMLPVMELIGMVVLLEAFESLEWFTKLLKPESDK